MMDDLNMRIAKVLGWTECDAYYGKDPNFGYVQYPNWSSDLNLMHELELDLETKEHVGYLANLYSLVGKANEDHEITWTLTDTYRLVHATSEQKAQAWLEVKEGRWNN